MATIAYRGEDLPVTLTITDGSNPVDLATLEGYIAIFYFAESGKVLDKFSKNTIAGYGDVEETDAPNGEFECKIQSAVTAAAEEGTVLVEVKTQTNDVEYTDNSFNTVVRDLEVCELCDAKSKDVTDLDP